MALHWSFLGLLIYLGRESWSAAGLQDVIWVMGYTVAIFTCVVMHELGHAMPARRFGVKVPRILLFSIEGMAGFDHIPRVSPQEWLNAIASPAVNAVLAVGLLGIGVRFPVDWDGWLSR